MKRIAVVIPVLICLVFGSGYAQQQYEEDFNADGKVTIADVVTLLLLARDNPSDPLVDHNGDGRYAINDAIVLLLAIRDGNLTPVEEPPAPTSGITMVPIPAGSFEMGSESEGGDE